MVLKKIASFINWLGGPDRKSGRVIWRRGYWRNHGYENQVWVRGTWIRRQKPSRQGIEGHDRQADPSIPRARKMTHEEIDEAVERYLRDGGTIKMLPETWYQIYQSEKMIWGFEG